MTGSKNKKITLNDMSAVDQYINLVKENRSTIDNNSAEPLNKWRQTALNALLENPLPKAESDNYENTDLEKMLAPDFGLNIAKINMNVNPALSFKCDVPTLSSHLFLFANDAFMETEKSRLNLPEGVEIGSLRKFAAENPSAIEEFYAKAADINNPVVALNTLLTQDGLYLRVKKNTIVDRPIQLVNILQNNSPLMAVRRLLIIVEENAEAKLIVCDHTQNQNVDFLSLETVEIFAKENSSFDFYALEESSKKTTRISALYLSQEKDSHVVIDGITLYNGTTRNEYYCKFNGKNAELRLLGIGIEDEERSVSTYSKIEHNVPECRSDELFKFTIDDNARGAFTGRIYVAPGATKTEAFQSNRNLVGCNTAKMTSRPELEIYNDDVKCSHGCAIGQLDEQQLFYMRTRGIDEADARLLLKQAFMADIIDGVRVEAIRERIRLLTERRFAGAALPCGSCAVNCSTDKI